MPRWRIDRCVEAATGRPQGVVTLNPVLRAWPVGYAQRVPIRIGSDDATSNDSAYGEDWPLYMLGAGTYSKPWRVAPPEPLYWRRSSRSPRRISVEARGNHVCSGHGRSALLIGYRLPVVSIHLDAWRLDLPPLPGLFLSLVNRAKPVRPSESSLQSSQTFTH